MPSCQAFNCTNKQGECKKSFFVIPNLAKDATTKRRCKQWINNLKNGKLSFETFVNNPRKLVCEDHFTPDCFEKNQVAESLSCLPRCKKLKPDAVPTLVNTCTSTKAKKAIQSKRNVRINYDRLQVKRERAKIKDNLLALKRGVRTSYDRSQVKREETKIKDNLLAHKRGTDKPHTMTSETLNKHQETNPSEIDHREEENINSQNIPASSSDTVTEPMAYESMLPYRLCGHPCNICLQTEHLKLTHFSSDHSYCTNTRTVGTMTEVTEISAMSFGNILTSTPIKKIAPGLNDEEKESFLLDDSAPGSYIDESHDSRDPTFIIEEHMKI